MLGPTDGIFKDKIIFKVKIIAAAARVHSFVRSKIAARRRKVRQIALGPCKRKSIHRRAYPRQRETKLHNCRVRPPLRSAGTVLGSTFDVLRFFIPFFKFLAQSGACDPSRTPVPRRGFYFIFVRSGGGEPRVAPIRASLLGALYYL